MDHSTLSSNKRQLRQTTQIDSLSDDLIIDILSRLPLLNLFQSCTLVSKSWCHLANLAFSLNDHFALAIIDKQGEDQLVFTLRLDSFHDRPGLSPNIINNTIITRSLDDGHFVFYHFCNGFYLLGYSPVSCNTPFHKRFPNISESSCTYLLEFCVSNALTFRRASLPPLSVTVPKNSKSHDCFLECDCNFWLAFDPRVSPYYKVILQAELYRHPSRLMLFSSETWKWRKVEMSWKTPLPDDVGAVTLGWGNKSVCSKGSAWRVCDIWSAGIDQTIMDRGLLRFDVEKESFELITPLPCKCDKGFENFEHYRHDVWEFRGTSRKAYLLQLLCHDEFKCVQIWGLKKNGGDLSYSWDMMYQVPWRINLCKVLPYFINPPNALLGDDHDLSVEQQNALSCMSSKEIQLLSGIFPRGEDYFAKGIFFLCLNHPQAR